MERPAPDDELPGREIEENSEQDDSGAQAQDVAGDARVRSVDLSEDSERGGRPNPAQIIPQDMEDLVEKMEAMNRSGRIDMDAYAGEPQMDDEEDILGDTEDGDDDPDDRFSAGYEDAEERIDAADAVDEDEA